MTYNEIPETIYLDFDMVEAETDKALLLHLDNYGHQWIPKSVVDFDDSDDCSIGAEPGVVAVHEWWFENNL